MALQTISQISKQFNISTRTLRYYEQIGLINNGSVNDQERYPNFIGAVAFTGGYSMVNGR